MNESGRSVTALGFALVLTPAALGVATGSRIGIFFDLVFISACVLIAWAVRLTDFYRVTVLPPALMILTFLLLAQIAPELIARPGDNLAQAVVSGLSQHAVALASGYACALGIVWWRLRQDRRVDATAALGGAPSAHPLERSAERPIENPLERPGPFTPRNAPDPQPRGA